MPKTLVTGATGFIGSHLAHTLHERGDELRLTVRSSSNTEPIDDLECERVTCDVEDRRSVRRAVKGVDRVFHAAGVTSVHPLDADRLFAVNVEGTKVVLEECLRAGVEKVVYTSSAAALGPASPGGTGDETQLFTASRLGIPYVNSVHEAEVEAMRLAARGLPLVCVNPTVTFGAGDVHVTSTRLVRSFLLGRMPVYTEGAANIVDVRDVAKGHLLADRKGAVGERYILGGRNFTYDRLFADLSRISGVDAPVKIPSPFAAAASALVGGTRNIWPLTSDEVRAARQWWTYRTTKAKRELGWSARPHEETLEATVSWHLEREHDRIARTRSSQQVQWRVAGAALAAAGGAAGVLRRAAGARP